MSLTVEQMAAVILSLQVAGLAVVLSLPFGIFVAWALARRRFPGQGLLNAAIHLPLILPPVVTGYGLLLLFGRRGVFGPVLESLGLVLAFRWTGAVLAAAVMAFPLMVRAMRLAFEAVDPRLEAAARTLGAPPWAVFATVTLPLILPGVLAGAVLAFAKGLGEFGATITFVANIPGQTQTLPTAIYTALQLPDGEALAARLTLISVALACGALALSEMLAARMRARIAGKT
jgi:molybdate transport system permease protein